MLPIKKITFRNFLFKSKHYKKHTFLPIFATILDKMSKNEEKSNNIPLK
jgi:hypothetical protein